MRIGRAMVAPTGNGRIGMNRVDVTIGKTGTVRQIDFDAFADNVKAYVINYGLTQILNDAHSSVTEKAEPNAEKRAAQVEALVDKKLAALMAGDVRARAGGVRDPIKARAIRIALGHVAVIKGADGKPDAKAMRSKAIKLVAEKAGYMMLAAKQIEDEKALGLYDATADEESPEADE